MRDHPPATICPSEAPPEAWAVEVQVIDGEEHRVVPALGLVEVAWHYARNYNHQGFPSPFTPPEGSGLDWTTKWAPIRTWRLYERLRRYNRSLDLDMTLAVRRLHELGDEYWDAAWVALWAGGEQAFMDVIPGWRGYWSTR